MAGPRDWSPRKKVGFFKVGELGASVLSAGLRKTVLTIQPDFTDSLGSRFFLMDEVVGAAHDTGDVELIKEAHRLYDNMWSLVHPSDREVLVYVRIEK